MYEDVDWRDLEAIKRLKYKYLRCLDQKRWEEMRECFVPEATAAYSGGKYSAQGIDEILAFLVKSMDRETFLSSHRVHHPEIDFVSPTEATGTWALEDVVIDRQWEITIQGAAFYEDRYTRGDDGVWRILHTGYLRTYEEIFPRKSIQGLRITADFYQTGGRSELDAG